MFWTEQREILSQSEIAIYSLFSKYSLGTYYMQKTALNVGTTDEQISSLTKSLHSIGGR